MKNQRLEAEIRTHAYLIKRGKPAANLAVRTVDFEEAVDLVGEEGLVSISREYYPGWYSMDIFDLRDGLFVDLIDDAPVFRNPRVEAWYWGKVYGYSDEAIALYTDELRAAALRAGGQRVSCVVERDGRFADDALVRSLTRLLSGLRHTIHLLSKTIHSIVPPRSDRKAGPA